MDRLAKNVKFRPKLALASVLVFCLLSCGLDAAKLTEDLGKAFRGDELSFKPYACGRPQHAILDAAIAARNQLGVGREVDVAEIAAVQVDTVAPTVAEQFNGAAHKRRPTQIVEAERAAWGSGGCSTAR